MTTDTRPQHTCQTRALWESDERARIRQKFLDLRKAERMEHYAQMRLFNLVCYMLPCQWTPYEMVNGWTK